MIIAGHFMRRVMLIDDEPDILHVVSRGLERFGIEVQAFATSMSALSYFKPNYYDAIILDIGMPEISGFELARKIWQLDENAAICFFSAFEQYENEAPKIFLTKNYCFVKKPIRIEKLASQIQTHLFSTSGTRVGGSAGHQ
jgi:DNA-binding response OmpR family regulator